MSAVMVSGDHISYLLSAAMAYTRGPLLFWRASSRHGAAVGLLRTRDFQSARATGQMLWHENTRSVRYRYSRPANTPRFVFDPIPPEQITVTGALKLLASYAHQSSECPDWEDTEAAAFCRALRLELVAVLPESAGAEYIPGFAPSTITTLITATLAHSPGRHLRWWVPASAAGSADPLDTLAECSDTTATQTARMLLRPVRWAYTPSMDPSRTYRYEPRGEKPVSPALALSYLQAYERACAATPHWRDSNPARFSAAAESDFVCALPGYREAPWWI